MQPYGKNLASFRGPKVSKGERREAGIRWIQPPKAVSDSEFRQTTSGAHGSANRADCLPRGKPFGAPAGAQLLPTGPDAPTAARVMGLPPRRGIVLSFDAKESTKESMRHGDSRGGPPRVASRASVCGSPFGAVLDLGSLRSPAGKRLLLPILSAGLAMSRAMELDSYHTGAERARARLFPPSKWAGLFPSAAYRRSASPQLAGGILNPCGLGCFDENWTFLQRQRPA